MAFFIHCLRRPDCLLFSTTSLWIFRRPGATYEELVQILKNTRQHLMTGVSHMIPFVVAGGILLAVSVMLYGKGRGTGCHDRS